MSDHSLLAGESVGETSLSQSAECRSSSSSSGTSVATLSDSALANGTGSERMLRKHRTLCTDSNELDLLVMSFSCHDSTVGNAIGRNCKEMHWTVGYNHKVSPIDIKLHVQERKLHNNEVRIESNGEPIFRGAGEHAKTKMIEDFCYQWPFRATILGIAEPCFFEFQPPYSKCDSWFPATITAQREDGLFEVTVQEPNQYGQLIEVKYPAVDKKSLREASTGKPLMVPEASLILEVPKDNPLHATLKMANGELVTHHFGKPSPPVSAQPRELCFRVSKDRRLVTADVGHSVLTSFVSGEVRSVMSDVDRLRRMWTFQLGPFAEHTVEIRKNYTLGKVITLLVDGEVLVESTPEEIGCDGTEWQCTFKLVGERVMDFEVFKTNKDGSPLDGTDHVKHRRKYVHECKVVLPNDWDCSSAKLFVDGVHFTKLPVKVPEREEQELTMDPLALQGTYGITTPYKVDYSAPSDLMAFTQSLMNRFSSISRA
jgi:hypothetical protein